MSVLKCTITVPSSLGSTSRGTYLSFLSFPFYSNFLSSYSNQILTVYFSSNSLLLKPSISGFNSNSNSFFFSFAFLLSTCHTSFSLISFSNFFTNSLTFFQFSNLSYIFSSAIYSFHYTK